MHRRRPTLSRRAQLARHLATVQRASALYGVDEYDEPLSGWFTDLKRKTSKVTSSVIGAAKSSGLPGISQIASAVRAGGQVAEETGAIPSIFRTKSAAASAPVTEFAPVSSGLPSWVWPAGIVAAIVILAKR